MDHTRDTSCSKFTLRFVKPADSVALYSSESWTLSTLDKRRIEAIEMWILKKTMKISWTEKKKSSMEVLNTTDEPRQMIKPMEIKETEFFEHTTRHNTFITNTMEGELH
ncbi:Hypothetical protein CINCED_3A008927 [Cinara cedri]|uniref:Uncharacterized protein n=1 Tax=Cinara cedri TaxID=506608 RepID=A0A5E4MYM5_9HEMI|nr:Hypothetical protein CINCED_3A008927 [Cinara cedri]